MSRKGAYTEKPAKRISKADLKFLDDIVYNLNEELVLVTDQKKLDKAISLLLDAIEPELDD